jgi:FMN-dependent NADH-azoreductase
MEKEATMKTLLQINTSVFSGQGNSTRLAEAFVRNWAERHPGSRVIVRDLAANPIPHLDAAGVQAFFTKPEDRTPAQQAYSQASEALIEELRSADVVVIGLPMYNFGIPSTLKAYFDQLARAGISFRYTPNGPEGLLGGRKVYVLAARGGKYQGTLQDTQTPFVQNFMNFIGIHDVEFVFAEGLNMGDQIRDAAMAAANLQIAALAA